MLEFLTAIVPLLGSTVQALVVVLVLLALIVRSGSPHVMLSFFWRKVMGEAPRASPHVQAWAEQREAWAYFRAQSGIATRTLRQSERLILWAQRNDEEIGDVKLCGDYFDLERLRLKLPTWFEKYFCVIALAASLTASLGFFGGTQLRWAWVEVKQAHAHYLKLDMEQVRVMHSGRSLRQADCKTRTIANLAADSGLAESEVHTICGWFEDPEFVSKVERTLAEQCTGFLILDLIALSLTWSIYRLFNRTMAARSMGKRMAERRKRRRKRLAPRQAAAIRSRGVPPAGRAG
jgi:hypothetical protein